ncbi:hypothetical protein E2C01_085323 [Portunus trituberculatus]|uniref:Uncharacterized protein n=1 Tax=Portunus trituberculatus TaxID=210409 RepID=A0A5B7J7A8_PORTR|nr:hypothetical protein [Portunus trituberculatus]
MAVGNTMGSPMSNECPVNSPKVLCLPSKFVYCLKSDSCGLAGSGQGAISRRWMAGTKWVAGGRLVVAGRDLPTFGAGRADGGKVEEGEGEEGRKR